MVGATGPKCFESIIFKNVKKLYMQEQQSDIMIIAYVLFDLEL